MSAPSPMRYSPSTRGFYSVEIHGDAIPDDAVRITHARHMVLLAGQAEGKPIYADGQGRPQLAPHRAPTTAQWLARQIAAIQSEASRRILAVASLIVQSNDNAAIATLAFQIATGALSIDDPSPAARAAIERRDRIDAIRTASNAIEATITPWAAAALKTFDASADALWPTEV